MAEFSKYNSFGIGRLLLHNNRSSEDGVEHSNENIDNERTLYNYFLKKGTAVSIQERLSEVFCVKRADTTVLGEMIVTLPKNVKEEDERDFFQAVYDFYANDFGEENIVNAVVHKDEVQPHIHLDFVPVVKGEPQFKPSHGQKEKDEWIRIHGEAPTERICCKDCVSRAYLQDMHPRLAEYVKEYLGYEVDVQNGATVNGNRTVLQLKAESLKQEIEKMETQQKFLGAEIGEMLTLLKRHGLSESDVGLYPLLQKIEDLERQNEVLKNIITRQDYRWKKEDLEAMQEKKYVPAKSVSVNVYDGSLVNAEIEDDAVVVIELPNEISRALPQRKLIDSDADLERQMRFVQSSTKQVMSRDSRVNKRVYLFIKTDDKRQTIDNLLLLEHLLREQNLKDRKVYMDRMETDEYDLARSILVKNQVNAAYFTNRSAAEHSKETEAQASREK